MGQYDPKLPKKWNAVSVSLVLGLIAGAYLGWFYLPHWYPTFRLTTMMKGACNKAYRIYNNDAVLNELVAEAQSLNFNIEKGDFEVERVEWAGEEIMAEEKDTLRDMMRKRGKSFRISFHKEIEAKWPLMDKWTVLVFDNEVETSLEKVTW